MDPVDQLFMQGVELMLAGIGSVFVFLVLLVIATRTMSWLIISRARASSGPIPEAHLKAISLAIDKHRGKRDASK